MMVRSLTSLCNALAAALAVLMVSALVVMFACVGIQVLARGVLGSSVLWLNDILMAGFTVSIFTGIALVFRDRSHLATSVIQDLLPPAGGRLLRGLVEALGLLAMVGLTLLGTRFAMDAFGQFTPVLRLPLGWVYLIIPVSAALSILFILEQALLHTDKQT